MGSETDRRGSHHGSRAGGVTRIATTRIGGPTNASGMARRDGDDLVGTLDRRATLLEALDERPRHKPGLVAELSVTRSTVNRAIRELAVAGLVERGNDGFALTTCGELCLDAYREFTAEIDAVRAAADVVEAIPSREYVDAAFLRGADVVQGTVSAPQRPVQAFVDVIEDAVSARGFSQSTYDAYVEVFEDRVVDGGMTAELVLSDDALTALTAEHGAAFERASATGRVDVHRIDSLPAFGLLIAERADGSRVATMGVYERDALSALVTNDSPASLAWASDVVDAHVERASPLRA